MDELVRVYIAASSRDLDRAGAWTARLAATGKVSVVSSWVDEIKSNGYDPNEGTNEERRQRADDCQAGVENSDIVWVLMPRDASMGAFWELGFASAFQLATCVSGPNQRASVFTEKVTYKFETDEDAFDFIVNSSMRQLYGDVD